MKKELIVMILVVALFILVFIGFPGVSAYSTYHTPISTGDTSKHVGPDVFDASGISWYSPSSKWFLLEQNRFYVYERNGSLNGSTEFFSCSGAAGDHEGVTTINNTSDTIIVQSESGGGICIMDADDIIDLGAVSVSENFDWPTNDADCGDGYPSNGGAEGLAFVPDATLVGICRHDGFLLAQDQTAGYVYKYCINKTSSALDCMSRWARPNCNGNSEAATLEYDYDKHLLYVGSDNGDATCVVDPFNFAGVLFRP